MRVPKWIAPIVIAGVLLAGCSPSSDDNNRSASPTATTVVADTAPDPAPTATPEPVETIDETPTAEPTETYQTPKAPKTRSVDPGLPLIEPISVELSCTKPSKLPKLAETNGNDYPKIVFNAMCGSEKSKNQAKYRFGQVGVGEGVRCGPEYIIDGNEPVGIAWWCPSKKILLSSPAAVIDTYPGDKWKLMRELTIAYAFAYVQTKHGEDDNLERVACIIGRTILNLRVNNLLSTGSANSLMDNFTAILEDANADSLNLKLRLGYNGERC